MAEQERVVIKTYKGSQAAATAAFQADAADMAAQGYFPTSQSWAPGTWGCGAFVGALFLCVVLVGILIFVYMLIVKPDGTLSVTYELHAVSDDGRKPISAEEKICPQCAETVKTAARICRFCRYEFPAEPETSRPVPNSPAPITAAFPNIGSRTTHSLWGAGAITAIDGEVVTVNYDDNQIRKHLRSDLRPYQAPITTKPPDTRTAFFVGSRVMHKHRGVGEVTAVDGDVISVTYADRQIHHHVRRDLTPL